MKKCLYHLCVSGLLALSCCQVGTCAKAGTSSSSGVPDDVSREHPLNQLHVPHCADMKQINQNQYLIICEERQLGTKSAAGIARINVNSSKTSHMDRLKRLAAARAWLLLGLLYTRSNNQKSALESLCQGIQELGDLFSYNNYTNHDLISGDPGFIKIDNIKTCYQENIGEVAHMLETRLYIASGGCADHDAESEYSISYPDEMDYFGSRIIMWIYDIPGSISLWGMPVDSIWPISSQHSTIYINSTLPKNTDNLMRRMVSSSQNTEELLRLLRESGATIKKARYP